MTAQFILTEHIYLWNDPNVSLGTSKNDIKQKKSGAEPGCCGFLTHRRASLWATKVADDLTPLYFL